MAELIGRLVYSKAGRDKGRPFVIIDAIDSNFVYIADGTLRKVEKPKKKKIKHLVITSTVFTELIEKKEEKNKFYNKEIKKILEVVRGNV